MDKQLLRKLNRLHENNNFDEIISIILAIPEDKRDYDLISHLARAYNNQGTVDEKNDSFANAIEQLLLIKDKGQDDPLWHYRMGYAYMGVNQFEKALKEFEISHSLDENDTDAHDFLKILKPQVYIDKILIDENGNSLDNIYDT